jgi:hypothetical protein
MLRRLQVQIGLLRCGGGVVVKEDFSRKDAKKWRGVWLGARVVELFSARVARHDLFLCGSSTLRLCVIPFRWCGCRYGWEEG